MSEPRKTKTKPKQKPASVATSPDELPDEALNNVHGGLTFTYGTVFTTSVGDTSQGEAVVQGTTASGTTKA